MVPVIIGVTLVAFVLVNVLPGNIVFLDPRHELHTPQAARVLEAQLHLNQPIVVRYYHWLGGLIHGNLGQSLITHQSIAKAIWGAAPPTIELIIAAQIIAIALGVIFAVASVASPTPWVRPDRNKLFHLWGTPVPAFVTALLHDHYLFCPLGIWFRRLAGLTRRSVDGVRIFPRICLAINRSCNLDFPGLHANLQTRDV